MFTPGSCSTTVPSTPRKACFAVPAITLAHSLAAILAVEPMGVQLFFPVRRLFVIAQSPTAYTDASLVRIWSSTSRIRVPSTNFRPEPSSQPVLGTTPTERMTMSVRTARRFVRTLRTRSSPSKPITVSPRKEAIP